MGTVTRQARRVFSAMPPGVQRSVKRVLAPLTYSRNIAGLSVSPEIVQWARVNPRSVSIVIPSYNDLPYLKACLASVEETCAAFDYEVIIVDDFCQQANSEQLKSLENSTVRVILKPERLGFAGAVNRGMTEAQHDVVLLNSDTVAQPGWLEALQHAAYAIDERIGMVSPKLIYPNGLIQYGGTYYARVLAPQWFGHLWAGSPATRPVANVASYNRSISGACVYITKAALAKVGLLDESYWLGFEDVDYGLKAWQAGVRCYYEPAAMLVHHESASRGYSQGKRELESMRFFWRRWGAHFIERKIEGTPAVDFVISAASNALWREYVLELAENLRRLGYETAVHESTSGAVDEATVAALSDRNTIKVACDWGVSETVWLASLAVGKPVHLLPGVESDPFPHDPGRQNLIIAHYKPEFDYIAPNRSAAEGVRGQTAWEIRARVAPVLALAAMPSDSSGVVTLGADAVLRARLDALAARLGAQITHFDETEPEAPVLAALLERSPRVIVAPASTDNSLASLRLMSIGAALVGTHNDKNHYEVLDGYNALLTANGDLDAIERAVTDVLSDDLVWTGLSSNGRATAQRLLNINAQEISRALLTIAANAV